MKKLPIYGIGPIYALILTILTALGITLGAFFLSDFFFYQELGVVLIMTPLGGALIAYGLYLWIPAAFSPKRIDYYIDKERLCTEGRYSIVRNPCYSGVMLIYSGILFLTYNLWLLLLIPLFYVILTLLLIFTEEKWLYEKFGDEYLEYKRSVPRIIPIFRRKKNKGDSE